MRFEERNTFFVSGYSVKTSEASMEKDVALLREKYEDKLRSIAPHLYLVGWYTENGDAIYLLGVETQNQTPIAEDATCVEVPTGCFAVGAVPEGAPIMAAWGGFFEKIPALGAAIDMEHGYFVGCFDENGGCELWTPVVKSDV